MKTCEVKNANRIKYGDIVVILLVIVTSIVSLFLVVNARAGDKGSIAVVEVNGRQAHRLILSDSQPRRLLKVRGFHGPSTIVFEKGRVRMQESTCRDKICIGFGWANKTGDSIVSLPNRVVIRIIGSRKSRRLDTVTE